MTDPYTSFDWRKYEVLARRTWDPKRINISPMRYLIRGYASELGEMADELKRWSHSHKPGLHDRLLLEIGDCLWYATMLRVALEQASGESDDDLLYTSLVDGYNDNAHPDLDNHFYTDIAVGLAQSNLYSGFLVRHPPSSPLYRGQFNTSNYHKHKHLLQDVDVWAVNTSTLDNEVDFIKDVARIAIAAGVSLVEAADRNIKKLESRIENDSVLATTKRNPS